MVDTGSALSLLSGVLQAVAYYLYFRGSLRREILPNPTTWLLFAYDTSLLVILHAALDADPMILLLPAVCATCSIGVAVTSWFRVGFRWPDEGADRVAIVSCVALTVGYVGLTVLAEQGLISPELRRTAHIVMLVFSNSATIVSFVPLIRSVRRNPATERATPWLVWTLAYGLLLVSTLQLHGWNDPALVLYPICNMALHLTIAGLATAARPLSRADRSEPSPQAPARPPA